MIQELLQQNKQWSEGQIEKDPDYFTRLAEGQKPEYLWIGCSDSRVPANIITGLGPGEVFVHRNIANLVHRGDLNLLSVLAYSVGVLKVKHIIVCGHYGCGGVHAAVDGNDHGMINHWLQPIRDVADKHQKDLENLPPEEKHQRLCELSVCEQVKTLSRNPIIKNAEQELKLHGWIYGLKDGLIRDLKC